MLDHEQTQGGFLNRRRAGRVLAITGAAVLAASSVFVPSSAHAALKNDTASEPGFDQEELLEDESLLGPMEEGALVVEEDEGALGMLRLDLNQRGSCRAQFRVTAQQWWINKSIQNRARKPDGSVKFNHGDGIRPWVNKIFSASFFRSFTATLGGISTRSGEGDVYFSDKNERSSPDRIIEARGVAVEGRMPVRVVRQGGETKSALVPCGRLQRFPFLLQVESGRSTV